MTDEMGVQGKENKRVHDSANDPSFLPQLKVTTATHASLLSLHFLKEILRDQ